MAIQIKGLDAEVLALSSALAVRTLQLELEHVYASLEAEALDVFFGLQAGGERACANRTAACCPAGLVVRLSSLTRAAEHPPARDAASNAASNPRRLAGLLARDGSTRDLALLVAEFRFLDEQLTLMAAAMEPPSALLHGSAAAAAPPASPLASMWADASATMSMDAAAAALGPGAASAAAAAMAPALLSDDVLGRLAAEIPDMRSRVGVP
jgi:hypothetical protein